MRTRPFAFVAVSTLLAACGTNRSTTSHRDGAAPTADGAPTAELAATPAKAAVVADPSEPSDDQRWVQAVVQRSNRVSPEVCNKANADRCESLDDTYSADTGRIQIVVHKPVLDPEKAVVHVADVDGDHQLEELHTVLNRLRDRGITGVRVVVDRAADGPALGMTADPSCFGGDAHLCLSDLTDVEIDFNGAEIIFSHPFKQGIIVERSRRVAVKNVTIDWDFQSAFRARVGAGGTFRVVDPEYPDFLPSFEFDSILPHDFANHTWYTGRPVVRLNFPTAFPSVVSRDDRIYRDDFFADPALFSPGDPLVILRNRQVPDPTDPSGEAVRARGHTIMTRGRDVNDLSFENVEIQASPQIAVSIANGGRGFHFKNCRVVAGPGSQSPLSIRGGGVIVFGSEGDVILEDSRFDNTGDDAFNIEGVISAVTRATYDEGRREMVATFAPGTVLPYLLLQSALRLKSYREGDRFAFLVDDQFPIGYGVVTRAAWNPATKTATLTFRAEDDTNLRAVAGQLDARRGKGLAADLSMSSSRYLVRNTTIRSTPARGLLLHAPNGVVEDNHIDDAMEGGIQARFTNGSFIEGPGAVNTIIRRNVIRRSSSSIRPAQWRGAIAIGTEGLAPDRHFALVQRVHVIDNDVRGSRGVAIEVTAAKQVVIEGNTNTGQASFEITPALARYVTPDFIRPTGEIYLNRANLVTIGRNRCDDGRRCTEANGVVLGARSLGIEWKDR